MQGVNSHFNSAYKSPLFSRRPPESNLSLNSTTEKQKAKVSGLGESARKFVENSGENLYQRSGPNWLRYATDHKEPLKNSTNSTKGGVATLSSMVVQSRLEASMTPKHTSNGHFLMEKHAQKYNVVDEIEIHNFTVGQSPSQQSLREHSAEQQSPQIYS